MPGTWPDGGGDVPDDPDDDVDAPGARGPAHPDDRLWRHPSELAWSAPPSPPGPPVQGGDAPRAGRVWTLAVTSGLTGAALALGVVALVSALGSPADVEPGERFALTGTAATTPSGLAAVAESVLPSVVRVEVDGGPGGTGLVVLDDGHVLTTAAAVDGADGASSADRAHDVHLVAPNGIRVPARVVGVDRRAELAVVAPIAGHEDDVVWTPAPLAGEGDLVRGDAVVAVGAAEGRRPPSLSVGVVAAVGRRLGTARGSWLHGMIETDAPVAAGAAGGPLCDRTGAVVGVSAVGEGGAGYATPIALARSVAEALMAGGEQPRVWLGIEGSDLAAAEPASVDGITAVGGVAIVRIVPGSPAEAAGLLAGDVVLSLDRSPVGSMDDLVAALRRVAPGEEITLAVRRGADTLEVDVTPAERDD